MALFSSPVSGPIQSNTPPRQQPHISPLLTCLDAEQNRRNPFLSSCVAVVNSCHRSFAAMRIRDMLTVAIIHCCTVFYTHYTGETYVQRSR